jgi:rhodanese-related sulfurtransferase
MFTRYSVPLLVLFLLSLQLFWCSAMAADTDEFPGRSLYPTVSVIEQDELYQRLNEVVLVDVRSSYEYETLRIKNALNIPLSSNTFIEQMRKLRAANPRPIVVYCNGKTCMKSYKAALKCAVSNIDNVHSFDAGILDWANSHPDQAELLGRSPVDPRKLISKTEFKKHLLSPDAYGNKVASTSAIVLDVRDRFQREGLSIFVGRERRAHLDNKKMLDRFIKKAKRENRPLLVHDAAGKQVRWLQYYLKDQGVSDYYFMEGGIAAYYDQLKMEFIR